MALATTRRRVLGGLATTVAAPALLTSTRAYAANPTIRVGHVSPRTGPLAGFAEADEHVLAGIEAAFADGISNNGKSYGVEIISKDSQSNPNRAAVRSRSRRISTCCRPDPRRGSGPHRRRINP